MTKITHRESGQVDTLHRDIVDKPDRPNVRGALQQSEDFSLTHDGRNACSRPVERRRDSMNANCINDCMLVKRRLRRVADDEMGPNQSISKKRWMQL
jgi:hypothetical protein